MGTSIEPTKQWAWNRFTVKQYERAGIVIRVLEDDQYKTRQDVIRSVFDEIQKGNQWIKDPSRQVTLGLITVSATTNEYRTFQGKPAIVLDYQGVESHAARHEMGHAVFDYYRSPSAPTDAALQIAALFGQLKSTKSVTRQVTIRGTAQRLTWPVGMWFVDPSEWSKGRTIEHPNVDADEFFASAWEAFATDPAVLSKSAERLAKTDPRLNALAKRLHQLFGELKQGKTPSHALKEPERAVANQELQDVPEPPAHEIEIATNVGTASVSLLQMVAEPEKSRAKPVTDRSKTAPKTPSVQPRRVPLAPQSAESGKGRRNQLAEHPRLLRRLWSWVSGGSAPIAPSNIARIRQRPGGPSRNPFQEGNILPPLKPPEPFGIGHGFSGPSTSPFQHPGIIPSRPKPPEPVGIGHGFSGPSTSPFQHPGIIPSRPKPPEPFGIRHGLAGDQRTDFFRRGEPVGPMRGQREEPWGRSRPLQTSGSGWNPDRFGFGASNQPVNLGRFILDAKIKLFDATRAGDRLGW